MTLFDEIEKYWDLRSNGFSFSVREEMETRGSDISEVLLSNLDLEAGSRILDLGCGPGLFSMLLSKAGMEVTAIDYSQKMIDTAKANASEEGLDIEFLKMDAQNLMFGDGSFDAVVSRNMMWALERPEDCYSEISRVLMRDGRLLIMDGNFYLHLYNEDYAKRPKIHTHADDIGGHGRHNSDGVDFNIMAELAKSLPLSRVERPSWDVNILCKKGFTDIDVKLPEIIDTEYRSRAIPSFMIVAKK